MGVLNIHLVNKVKRQLFVKAIMEKSELSICGVVESWLVDSAGMMEAEIYGTEWMWLGRGRKGKKGGGLGFLVKKSLKPRLPKASRNSNILWLEVDHEGKWYIAVVYLIPKDSGEVNEETLVELQRGVLELESKGRVVVAGDFNARVGELPNTIFASEDSVDSSQVMRRKSVDKTVNRLGHRVLACLNELGMVLLNGLGAMAKYTSFQAKGNSVIDFFFVHSRDLKAVVHCDTVEEERFRLSDHVLVAVTFKMGTSLASFPSYPSLIERRAPPPRWNSKSRDGWGRLQKFGNQFLLNWSPRHEGRRGDSRREAEEVWDNWLREVRHTAELGIGYGFSSG
jgi:hypothetical protein